MFKRVILLALVGPSVGLAAGPRDCLASLTSRLKRIAVRAEDGAHRLVFPHAASPAGRRRNRREYREKTVEFERRPHDHAKFAYALNEADRHARRIKALAQTRRPTPDDVTRMENEVALAEFYGQFIYAAIFRNLSRSGETPLVDFEPIRLGEDDERYGSSVLTEVAAAVAIGRGRGLRK